mgnify:CR=1 FL=1
MKKILVLNPNSSTAVTDKISASYALCPATGPYSVQFDTLAVAPPGIETQRDVEEVTIPTCDHFKANPAQGYVIGCFSDPGLYLCRQELDVPVVGIAESAFLTGMSLGGRFGIMAIKQGSIGRHMRALHQYGLMDFLAADRPLNLGVQELLDEKSSIGRLIEVGRTLRDVDGARSLILGCASMGAYRPTLQKELGIPVIDPVQAAVARMVGLLTLGYVPE